jgi:hypothetical protein
VRAMTSPCWTAVRAALVCASAVTPRPACHHRLARHHPRQELFERLGRREVEPVDSGERSGPHSVAIVGQRRRAVCRRHVLDAEQLVVRRSLEAGPGNAGSGNGSRPATAVARRRSVRSVAGCRHGRRDRSERRPSSGSLPTISVTTAVVPRRAAPGTSAAVARRQSPSPVGRRVFRSLPKCLPPGASDPSTGPVSPSTHEGRFADRPKSDGRRYRKVWVSIAPVPRGPILGSPYAVLL